MKIPKKANVLGTEYKVMVKNQEEIQKIFNNKDLLVDGLCDYENKTIYIDSEIAKEPYGYKTTLRHELIHSAIEESGLATQVSWARNESLVDWIALQFPKLYKIFEKLDLLN